MKQIITLYIIENDGRVLLSMKKHGTGAGVWKGFRGKIPSVSDLDASGADLSENSEIPPEEIHQLSKNTGFTLEAPEKRGEIKFFYPDRDTKEVHVYSGTAEGKPRETDEMVTKWFPVDKIPYDSMLPDDEYWLPFLLSGNNFKASLYFDKQRNISKQHLEKIKSFD
ncbi:MAG TPA: hypothetical protein VFM02_00615 [Candidatus Paceibacterota bacterium]|nr:hypothetical protein [Candidatus Paceibacterota bacterium]